MQADYILESITVILSKPYVQDAIYCNWRDAKNCWQCKDEDCPIEIALGLLNNNSDPKKALWR